LAKPELGEKRICPSCGTKYYDLNRDPIICPKCAAPFEIIAAATAKAKPEKEADEKPSDEIADEDDTPVAEGPEIISLDDADEDDGDTVDGADDEIPDDIPDVEIDDDNDDDQADGPFLEDDDEDDDNLSDIIPTRGGDDDET